MVYLGAILVIVDFLSKRIVEHLMIEGQSIQLLPGLLSLTYVRNPGAAFGMFANQTWFFVTVAVVLIVAVAFAGRRLTGGDRLLQAALAVMLSGALGNLIDRVTSDHHVVDFLELPHWPVFNVADMALLTGVGLYLFGTLRTMAAERQEGHDR